MLINWCLCVFLEAGSLPFFSCRIRVIYVEYILFKLLDSQYRVCTHTNISALTRYSLETLLLRIATGVFSQLLKFAQHRSSYCSCILLLPLKFSLSLRIRHYILSIPRWNVSVSCMYVIDFNSHSYEEPIASHTVGKNIISICLTFICGYTGLLVV